MRTKAVILAINLGKYKSAACWFDEGMKKALQLMNVKLIQVFDAAAGKTGMAIVRAILGGDATRPSWRRCGIVDEQRRGDDKTAVRYIAR